MHYLYRITNIINSKIYIGQSRKPDYRWSQHISHANGKKPQYLHYAIAKYGSENFIFEVIATCKNQEDANIIEEIIIAQYDSRNKQFGYNIKPGGNTSPQSEETKEKIRQATIKQIAERGHPAQGHTWTDEQKANLSATLKALDKEAIYTEQVRKNMSEAHIGIKDTEETKRNKSISGKASWEKRIDYSRKCSAPGCEAHGKIKYKIINGVRYCNKHGLRMLRNNTLDPINP